MLLGAAISLFALMPACPRSLKFLYSFEDNSEAPTHPLVSRTPAGIWAEPGWTCREIQKTNKPAHI